MSPLARPSRLSQGRRRRRVGSVRTRTNYTVWSRLFGEVLFALNPFFSPASSIVPREKMPLPANKAMERKSSPKVNRHTEWCPEKKNIGILTGVYTEHFSFRHWYLVGIRVMPCLDVMNSIKFSKVDKSLRCLRQSCLQNNCDVRDEPKSSWCE